MQQRTFAIGAYEAAGELEPYSTTKPSTDYSKGREIVGKKFAENMM